MITTLRNLFTPSAVVESIETLPIMQSTVMDTFFKERPAHNTPLIGRSVIERVARTIPVTRRDGNAIPLTETGMDMEFIAPLPLKPSIKITAAELNDMKAWCGNTASLEGWRNAKIEELRTAVRNTTEAMCATVLTTGKVEWPLYAEAGHSGTYSIDFGAVPTYTPTALLSASSTLSSIYNLLSDLELTIQKNGFGGRVEFYAGKAVTSVLLDIAESSATTVGTHPYKLSFQDGLLDMAGYKIHMLNEYYPSPLDETSWLPKIESKVLQAVAMDAKGAVHYCAVDNFKANNAPSLFHVTPIEKPDGSAIELIAQAKPLPCRASKSSCKVTAVA